MSFNGAAKFRPTTSGGVSGASTPPHAHPMSGMRIGPGGTLLPPYTLHIEELPAYREAAPRLCSSVASLPGEYEAFLKNIRPRTDNMDPTNHYHADSAGALFFKSDCDLCRKLHPNEYKEYLNSKLLKKEKRSMFKEIATDIKFLLEPFSVTRFIFSLN